MVFGQTVKVNAATVFEGITFNSIVAGDILEVHGFADSTGVVTASRIENEGQTSEFKLRGVISNHDAVARTFRIGAAVFNYSSTPTDRLPSGPLANGLFVRVRTTTLANPGGQWLVTRIELRSPIDDCDESEVEGILLQSGTSFSINGLPIDVSRLPPGTVLPVNQRVEAEGAIVNGVLVVSKIEREDDDQAEVDVRGTVSAFNAASQTFVVRGVTFHYTLGSIREEDGTIAANLTNGAAIRVKGRLASGGTVEATEIDFRP
ncbi:hypothetical protein D3H34_32200 [Acidovorax cavernicola]|uniref:DUF5666 domain-containing protein n=1 Tax=Acidovorax cavernicola TaxID=1675792 RepID=A0A9X8GRS3_9BURK|nr:hypothetical protein D3H34_32200 [Acidovorax cavernicola]